MGNVLPFCLHKFASNVVERCLEYGSASEKSAIVEELVAPTLAAMQAHPYGQLPDPALGQQLTPIQVLIKDQFGNYVVQRCMDAGDDAQRAALVDILRQCAPLMRRYAFGKHILARLDKMTSKSLLPVPVNRGPGGMPASAPAAATPAPFPAAPGAASAAASPAASQPHMAHWQPGADLTAPPSLGLELPTS